MPPGTGDVSISLGQLLPRAEVVVVTTPQPRAQQVAVRAAQMAQKTGMRLIGAIENMSYLVGTGQEIFGAGGGEALARGDRRAAARQGAARPAARASPPTPASRSSGPSPRTRRRGRSSSSPRRSRRRAASRARSRSRFRSLTEDTKGARRRPSVRLVERCVPLAAAAVEQCRSCPGSTGTFAPSSPLSVLPTIVADQLPRSRAHGDAAWPVASPSRWLPLSITADSRAFDLGRPVFAGLGRRSGASSAMCRTSSRRRSSR